MSDFHSPELAGAAGSLLYILVGGFKGAWWHRIGAFASGFGSATFLGPMVMEMLERGTPQAAAGVHFLIGATTLLIYARLAQASISASIAGVNLESKGHE